MSTAEYWEWRYRNGGNSGAGSYGALARYKAGVVNEVIRGTGAVRTVEWGCGDGNQLGMFDCAEYLGIDTSPCAIEQCRARYSADPGKRFLLAQDEMDGATGDLAISLEVIFHILEDHIYDKYMERLFDTAPYVLIFSSDTDTQDPAQSPHMRHHCHSAWVARNAPGFAPIAYWANPHFPHGSVSIFKLYGRIGAHFQSQNAITLDHAAGSNKKNGSE